jgi:hypothetical protein
MADTIEKQYLSTGLPWYFKCWFIVSVWGVSVGGCIFCLVAFFAIKRCDQQKEKNSMADTIEKQYLTGSPHITKLPVHPHLQQPIILGCAEDSEGIFVVFHSSSEWPQQNIKFLVINVGDEVPSKKKLVPSGVVLTEQGTVFICHEFYQSSILSSGGSLPPLEPGQ